MEANLSNALQVMGIGIGVVFASLLVLYAVMVIMPRLLAAASTTDLSGRGQPGTPTREPGWRPPPGARMDSDKEPTGAQIPPQVVAAILAAVQASMEPGYRPFAIRLARSGPRASLPAWTRAARQEQVQRWSGERGPGRARWQLTREG